MDLIPRFLHKKLILIQMEQSPIFGYGFNWFNQLNNDIDFRVDGDSNDYVLFVDA